MRLIRGLFLVSILLGPPLIQAHPKVKETRVRTSAYRRYFWGARDAFEKRKFEEAQQLFDTYKSLGSPRDKLVTQSGCDAPDEVPQFAKRLKDVRQCIASKAKNDHYWTSFDKAKLEIFQAFRDGDASSLLDYIGCAPVDLTFRRDFCPASNTTVPQALQVLAGFIHDSSGMLGRLMWRESRVASGDEVSPRWTLYCDRKEWAPNGLPNAPLMTLREDRHHHIRIAGFAASGVASDQ